MFYPRAGNRLERTNREGAMVMDYTERKTSMIGRGIVFYMFMLTSILALLKFNGLIDVGWWMVIAPVWVPVVCLLGLVFFLVIIFLIALVVSLAAFLAGRAINDSGR